MTLNEILDEWDKDSNIDVTILVQETIRSAKLHSKYKRIYINEKNNKYKYEIKLKELNVSKYEYYAYGIIPETEDWPIFTLKLSSPDIKKYLASDKDLIKLTTQISVQNEKLDLIEDILKEISNRTYHFTNIREFMKLASPVHGN